jgi:ribosomal protein L7/L12
MDRQELEREVKALVEAGRKIAAVRLVQREQSLGLTEAQAYVNRLISEEQTDVESVSLPDPAEIRALVAQGRKIAAVKRVRETTGWGLRRAKEYVDERA